MKEKLIVELLELSRDDKITILNILRGSLQEEEVSISDSQLKIIREREEDYKAGNQKIYSWEEVKRD